MRLSILALVVFCSEVVGTDDLETVLELSSAGPRLGLPEHRVAHICSVALQDRTLSGAAKYEVLMARGIAHHAARKYLAAVGDFEAALTLRRGDVDASVALASSLFATKEPARARHLLEEVIKNHPDYAPAYSALAYWLAQQPARSLEVAEQFASNAISRFQDKQARERFGRLELAKAYTIRADLRYRRGKAKGALADLDFAIRIAPLLECLEEVESPYIMRGVLRTVFGEYEEATSDFCLAQRLNPKSIDASIGLCSALSGLNKKHMCHCQAERITREHPKNPRAWVILASAAYYLRGPEEALVAARKGLTVAPTDSKCRLQTGILLALAGRHKEAISECAQAVEGGVEVHEATIWKALLVAISPDARIRNSEKARELAARLLSARIEPDAMVVLALTDAEDGNFAEAIEKLTLVRGALTNGSKKLALEDLVQSFRKQQRCRTIPTRYFTPLNLQYMATGGKGQQAEKK